MTNEEKMKSMTTEELADWLCDRTRDCTWCEVNRICATGDEACYGYKAWLKKEVEEE